MPHDRGVCVGGIDELREHAFSASPIAQVAVSPKNVGRPPRDLDLSYRPIELRGPGESLWPEIHVRSWSGWCAARCAATVASRAGRSW